jgi:hypothetical protein
MAREHENRPGSRSKGEDSTGIPSQMSPERQGTDEELTERYTEDDQQVADNVPLRHPNRNRDKDKATGIGGYRGGIGS